MTPVDTATPDGQQVSTAIELRGVRVHNLQNVDLSIPLKKLTVVTGVSGAGKSSLAFGTLFTEGQRRFIESFPASTRRFLARPEKPDADRIDHVPPSIVFEQDAGRQFGPRATIATVTEIQDGLRLLFARLGAIVCPKCERPVRRSSPQSILSELNALPENTRFQIGFTIRHPEDEDPAPRLAALGFTRWLRIERAPADASETAELLVIVDRLVTGKADDARCLEALESALMHGEGRCVVLTEATDQRDFKLAAAGATIEWDKKTWRRADYSERLSCTTCGQEFIDLEPRLFSFQSPMGACRECRGAGVVTACSVDALLSDRSISLAENLAAFPVTPAGKNLLNDLMASLRAMDFPLDAPLIDWTPQQRERLRDGHRAAKWRGLQQWMEELETQTQRPGVRGILKRARVVVACRACQGERLRPEALAVRLLACSPDSAAAAPNIADLGRLSIRAAEQFLEELPTSLGAQESTIATPVLRDLRRRLDALRKLGLEEPSLSRPMRSLSDGEARRVALAATLSTALVRALYVLDEPTAGMHPVDVDRVKFAVTELLRKKNTVVLVEHDPTMIALADQQIELGPGAGPDGGRVLFAGSPAQKTQAEDSFAKPRSSRSARKKDAVVSASRVRLSGCRLRNLQNLTVDIPLGVLCVVSGVSGAGKSSLVEESFVPAVLASIKRSQSVAQVDGLPVVSWIDAHGEPLPPDHPPPLGDVVHFDQRPLPGSLRSTPATCLKLFEPMRRLFAETAAAQSRNYGPSHFSFNARDGGRCQQCEGLGRLNIDMQFLPDLAVTCPECRGARFRREALEIQYRGLNIDEVLRLTVREAWQFFSRQPRLLKRMQPLRQLGLDYLPLGRSISTLSGGERQRLKLAMKLTSRPASRTMFVLEAPSSGLHGADVDLLTDCFAALLEIGHSLLVVDNHPALIAAADWRIELGPGAGSAGGKIVHAGPPAS